MILYKYVDSKTADIIIKDSTLKFSKATSLNDPFELTSLHYGTNHQDEEQEIRFISACMSYGILSLTRNPLNPLMWAHYGKGKKINGGYGITLDRENGSHAGVVLGIDVDEAGLNNHGSNIIPAKFGSVIYTSTKPKSPFVDSTNRHFFEGIQHNFNPEILEALQRTFLYKPSYWSYEEEVRVIRNVIRRNNEIQKINTSSIKEYYIGFRNSFNKKYLTQIKRKIKKALPNCEIYVCCYDKSEWTFNKIPIDEAIIRCIG
ncbi:TPA: DUF2971 domain-containing protein [Klebsiella pneumoniae]|uniref:DUF2971 domain-containing protein n=1 Tax=Klebsiella pneumoniae complex TaxID=3390273 RepID=UPI000E2E33EA|nr:MULTISPECIES: DUF2971 domain-containing protein [Klebsiella]MBU8939558.1 DUF2971 domain-containing protein [Klebsiella quasipneumoniae]SYU59354.1 Protein of uncharacterised function (DUF2971) [Klebsiella pneumoniae]HCB0678658.1 DUF2971 domain-containing protein [Klebsiella pneumoniae]HDT5510900.1 DUF2971 domain-containing protein [Klebsiella pneumoniae]HDU3485067.1 DUF2971 domain-containing protein [Klebsiella pneumoniae]